MPLSARVIDDGPVGAAVGVATTGRGVDVAATANVAVAGLVGIGDAVPVGGLVGVVVGVVEGVDVLVIVGAEVTVFVGTRVGLGVGERIAVTDGVANRTSGGGVVGAAAWAQPARTSRDVSGRPNNRRKRLDT